MKWNEKAWKGSRVSSGWSKAPINGWPSRAVCRSEVTHICTCGRARAHVPPSFIHPSLFLCPLLTDITELSNRLLGNSSSAGWAWQCPDPGPSVLQCLKSHRLIEKKVIIVELIDFSAWKTVKIELISLIKTWNWWKKLENWKLIDFSVWKTVKIK